jgi:hypothetical protein
MTKSYRYLKVGSLYLSLEHNVFILSWLLFFNANSLVPENRTRHKLLQLFIRLYRVLCLVLPYTAKRYGPVRRRTAMITLPLNGHVALRLRFGNYKVFDLGKSSVFTTFMPGLQPSVLANKVKKAKELGKYEFAPRLKQWHGEGKWLEEEYINGSTSPRFYSSSHIACASFLPFIETLMLSTPPRVVHVRAYLSQQQRILAELENNPPAAWLSRSNVRPIKDFVEEASQCVLALPITEIGLTLSHGDLWAKNLLITQKGHRAVDWDDFDFRSSLHDLYFIFFRILERKTKPEPALIAAKLGEAKRSLKASVARRKPELLQELFLSDAAEDAYRWLFYIEHVCLIAEHLQQITREDIGKGNLAKLMRHIELARVFEGIVTENTPDSPQAPLLRARPDRVDEPNRE